VVDFEKGSFVNGHADSGERVLSIEAVPEIVLTQTVTPASTHPLFLAFGIEFYQEVNGNRYALRNGAFNALAIVGVG
jgi:hypothetical protein